ncbi:type III-A CRISPR-associated protein Csm2 [Aquifex sp.]
MKGHKTKEQAGEDKLRELIQRLKEEPIANIHVRELVKPGGYAYSIVGKLGVKRSQLRRIFAEMKEIFERVKDKGTIDEEIEVKFYMLYPIIEYQKNRGVVKEPFARLMEALLDNLERYKTLENFEQAERFLTALVAYMKREA